MRLFLAEQLSGADRELARQAGLEQLLQASLLELGEDDACADLRMTVPDELRKLNRQFAGLDHSTDVLSFPARAEEGDRFRLPPGQDRFLGDIVISIATAKEQAGPLAGAAADELRLLAVHGLLHLLGRDHEEPEEAREMTRLSRELLLAEASRRGRPQPLVPELEPSR